MSRVYILGAGATAGYKNSELRLTPPVARTFFQVVGRLLHDGDGLDQDGFADLWRFLDTYYKVATDQLVDCGLDIEEVLTLLDVGKAKHKARRQLLDLIAITLDRILRGNPCHHHRRLVRALRGEDAIITFNWDLLVDNIVALDHAGGPDYGVNLLEPVEESAREDRGRVGGPLVLKPHGSMNWMTCRECHKNFAHILTGKTGAEYHAGKEFPCRYCGTPTEPLMIPPTLLKNYRHPVIKAVWKEARRVLRQADEVIVVGYSLPVTDFKAKWLFMEASASRRGNLRGLTIVDHVQNPKRQKELKEKFRRAFHADEAVTRIVTGGIQDVPCHIPND